MGAAEEEDERCACLVLASYSPFMRSRGLRVPIDSYGEPPNVGANRVDQRHTVRRTVLGVTEEDQFRMLMSKARRSLEVHMMGDNSFKRWKGHTIRPLFFRQG